MHKAFKKFKEQKKKNTLRKQKHRPRIKSLHSLTSHLVLLKIIHRDSQCQLNGTAAKHVNLEPPAHLVRPNAYDKSYLQLSCIAALYRGLFRVAIDASSVRVVMDANKQE